MSLGNFITQLISFNSLPQQLQVYQSQLGESKTLARHHRAYKALRPLGLGHIVWALYGFRVAAQYYVGKRLNVELIAFAAMPNHSINMNYICSLSDGLIDPYKIERTRSRKQRVVDLMRFALRLTSRNGRKTVLKGVSVISMVDKRYGWVQALNVSTFIFGLFSFKGIFGPDCKICFTANDFSPLPLAFKYTGRQAGLKQMFTMHGQISAASSGNLFPRLDYDVAFLYGKAALESYLAAGDPKGLVLLTGFPGESIPLRRVPDRISTIGVCLANYYDDDTQAAISHIAALYPDSIVIVRTHPRMAQILSFPLEKNIAISDHENIKIFAQSCNFAIAGNTGAQLDLLKLGCPVTHYPMLDKLGDDDIGLVADEVAMLFEGQKSVTPRELNRFFDSGWIERFRRYDSLYLADDQKIAKCHADVQTAYESILK